MSKVCYLTTSEVASKLRTSKQMLLRYLRRGTLTVTPRILGSKWLWVEHEIDEYILNTLYQPELKGTSKKKGRPAKTSTILNDVSCMHQDA